MKKLLATLAIAAIALTSTFAVVATSQTNTNNITVNGSVEETTYSFELVYASENADSGNLTLNETVFDLSKTEQQSTDIFYLQRSNGNLNKDLLVAVDITAKAFEGEVNGTNVRTSIKPEIALNNESGNSYANIKNGSNARRNTKSFDVTVPYGYNPENKSEIASFILNITGDSTTDAGKYTSDVVINYTYDQI